MRWPGVRFTVRWLMAAVAVAALASLAASVVCREYPGAHSRMEAIVVSAVAGAFGVGAVRRPMVFLTLLLMIWVATPSVDHPGVLNLSAGGCFLGWVIGAPAGWLSRHLTRHGLLPRPNSRIF